MAFFENNKYFYKLVYVYKNVYQNMLVKKIHHQDFCCQKKKKQDKKYLKYTSDII